MIPKWFKAGHKELVVLAIPREADKVYIQEVVESILREKGVKPKRFHFTITIHYEE